MNDREETQETSDSEAPFESLHAMRIANSELLKRFRENGATRAFSEEVASFVRRGMATGVYLDGEDDRWAAQSLLDYWTTKLYSEGLVLPEAVLADFDSSLAPELDDSLSPYLGLDAFRDSEYFFGRDRAIEEMVKHLEENQLLIVVGPSGSGKSSIVMGGLIGALKSGELAASEPWRIVPPMVPGSQPLQNLARALRPENVDASEWMAVQADSFSADPEHLSRLVAGLGEGPAVVVVDQFEELFTLCDDESVRQSYVDNLLSLIDAPDDGHRLILTMRSDYESQIVTVPALEDRYLSSKWSVPPLNASELREAIVEPAELIGLRFEDGLVDQLVHDILGDPAALPLLQFTLLRLWEERDHNRVTWQAYRELGGGRLALARSADRFYEQLSIQRQVAAKRILLRLVRPGEGLEIVSNRVLRETLLRLGDARTPEVLDLLEEARLVRITGRDNEADTQVEIAHEALVRNWPRLVDWLDDERERLRQRLRLTAAARQWHDLGRDPAALLRGALLEQAKQFRELDELEKEYVRASQAAVAKARREEQEALRIRLEQAQQLAEEQALRAEEKEESERKLRLLVIGLAIAVVATVFFAISATSARRSAEEREEFAQDKAAVAEREEAIAVAAQGTAQAKAAIAETEEAIAVVAHDEALNLQATAQAQSVIAERERAEASGLLDARDALAVVREDPALAMSLGLEAIEDWHRQMEDSYRAEIYYAVSVVASTSQTRMGFNHGQPVYAAAMNGDRNLLLSGAGDGSLVLWDLSTGQRLDAVPDLEAQHRRGHRDRVWSVAISPDGSTAVSGSADGTIMVWNLEDGKLDLKAVWDRKSGSIWSVAFHPEKNNLVLVASSDKSVLLWDLENLTARRLVGHEDWVYAVAFSPDGTKALSGSEDGTLILWDLESRGIIHRFVGHEDWVRSVAFSPDGERALSGSANGTLILWDIESGQALDTFSSGDTSSVYSVSFDLDGDMALSGSDSIILWDLENDVAADRFSEHQDKVRTVAFSADGKMAVSGSIDGTLRLWDFENSREVSRLGNTVVEEASTIQAVDIAPDGKRALLGLENGDIILWDLENRKRIDRFTGHAGGIWGVTFSPRDRGLFVSGSSDDTLIVWDIETGSIRSQLIGHTNDVRAVAITPDGERVLSGSYDGTLRLWDLDSGREIRRFEEHTNEVRSVAISADGRTALSGSTDTDVIWWDLESDEALLQRFTGSSDEVRAVAFGPDGTALSAGEDGDLIQWQLEGGAEIRRLRGDAGDIVSLAVSLDGQVIVAGSENGQVLQWELLAGGEDAAALATLHDGVASVWGVAFSDDGSLAMIASGGQAIVWDLEAGQPLQSFQSNDTGEGSGHRSPVKHVAFDENGRTLSADVDGNLIAFDPETGQVTQTAIISEVNEIQDVAFSATQVDNGTVDRVLFSGRSGLTLWDVDGDEVATLGLADDDDTARVTSVAVSPDGRRALSGSADGTLILWNLEERSVERRLGRLTGGQTGEDGDEDVAEGTPTPDATTPEDAIRGHTGAVNAVAFGPEGERALSASSDGTLIIWDLGEGTPDGQLGEPGNQEAGLGAPVLAVVFSHDGEFALSGDENGVIIYWDLEKLEEVGRFDERFNAVTSIAWSSNDRVAVSGDRGGNIILWDVPSGRVIRRFAGHTAAVTGLAFGPDERTILSGSDDNTVRLWQLIPMLSATQDDPQEAFFAWVSSSRFGRQAFTVEECEEYRIEDDDRCIDEDDTALVEAPLPSQPGRATARLGENQGTITGTAPITWTYRADGNQILFINGQPEHVADEDVVEALQEDQPEEHELFDEVSERGQLSLGVKVLDDNDQELRPLAIEVAAYGGDAADQQAWQLPVAGDYRIVVENGLPTQGNYALTLSPLERKVLPFGEHEVDSVSPVNAWTFFGEEGQLAHVDVLEFAGNQDAGLTVLAPDGEVLVAGSSSFLVNVAESGQYTILTEGVGRYDTLVLHEIGETLAPLSYGETRSGTMADGLTEYWTFEGQTDEIAQLAMGGETSALALQIFDPTGKLVADYRSGDPEQEAMFTRIRDGGDYVIAVRSIAATEEAVPYNLSLSLAEELPIAVTGFENFLIVDHGKDKQPFSNYETFTVTESAFADLTLDDMLAYHVIYFEPDWLDYDNLSANMTNLAEYVELGGIVVINIAGNIGDRSDVDPGGTDYSRDVTHESETIAMTGHPYITGNPFIGSGLTQADFDNWNATDHGNLESFPVGSDVVLENEHGASWIHYQSGAGHVVLTTLTYGWICSGDICPRSAHVNLVEYALSMQGR